MPSCRLTPLPSLAAPRRRLVMIPMFLSFKWGDRLFRSPYLSAVTITGIALLMVSKVPTVSLKRIRIPHHMVIPTLLAFGVATAFLMTAPSPTPDRRGGSLSGLDPADDPLVLPAETRRGSAQDRTGRKVRHRSASQARHIIPRRGKRAEKRMAALVVGGFIE
jgi:hypothetical protein